MGLCMTLSLRAITKLSGFAKGSSTSAWSVCVYVCGFSLFLHFFSDTSLKATLLGKRLMCLKHVCGVCVIILLFILTLTLTTYTFVMSVLHYIANNINASVFLFIVLPFG